MLGMLKDLSPFFEDCYRRINVREYAKIAGVSPPTASKLLGYYAAEGLLVKTAYKNYILFYANKGSRDFIDLSRLYWGHKLADATAFLEKKLANPAIVLFGSLSKAEAKGDSDIDLAVFAQRKEVDMREFEKKLKRKLQVFFFSSFKGIKNTELATNIANGYVLKGRLL